MSWHSTPDLSILITSHNHCGVLAACLESIERNPCDARLEIIVIDNTGEDGTGEMVRRRFPHVRLIRNDKPLGYAANVNQGLRLAGARYPMVLNPDVEVLPGALDVLVRFMDGDAAVGLAGPKLLNSDGSVQYSCRRFTTPAHFLLRGLRLDRVMPRARVFRDAVYQDWDHASARDVDYVTGACMIVRREALVEVGPMDEGFRLYFEDQDWCYRMWQAGWRVGYVPQAQMFHHHQRASARGLLSAATRTHVRSMIRFFRKHYLPWPLRLRNG